MNWLSVISTRRNLNVNTKTYPRAKKLFKQKNGKSMALVLNNNRADWFDYIKGHHTKTVSKMGVERQKLSYCNGLMPHCRRAWLKVEVLSKK